MRRIAVVTTSRADYGLLRPVLRRLSTTPGVEVQLVVSGSHLSPAFGLTVREIEADGRPIADRVEVLLASDSPEGVTKTMGLACIGLGQSLARLRPDILVVLGDRFEMHAAALAALPFLIPVAHIHGGESTLGAFDDCLRHSMTKLSHLHFVAAEEYARRVIQLGEELWRVTVSGSPGLDNLADWEPTPVTELEGQVGMPLPCHGFLLAAFHPVTLEQGRSGAYAEELVAALARTSMPVLVSLPNADPSGREVRVRLLAAVALRPGWCAVENLGTRSFFSVMARAAAMAGNSSSGLI
ncbi:MAG TPA: UDP-N-acetylglucosamine 2-epimerase, partial [Thermoanaerobaculaceae bacterium]|nr:UDP-N-acetylglucosamine 2-epimerase [Thermoanaerobaculaceae bacterium]